MSVPIESYKNYGALALALFWATTTVMILLLKGEKSKSISAHVASVRNSALIFGVVSTLSTVLWILFFVKWFTPTYHLGTSFNILVLAALLLYCLAGAVPDVKGIRHKIHVNASVVASVLLLPTMLLLCMNTHVGTFARVFTTLALFTMSLVGYVLMKNNRTHDKLLIFEALYFLCFDVSILVVTYIR